MKTLLSSLTITAVIATATSAQATLLTWETFGNSGSEATVAATNVVAGITGLDLARGAGLNPSNAGNSFSSNNWAWDGPGDTRNADDYFSFGFTVDPGNQVENLGVLFGSRSSNTGPGPMALYWSDNNFATPILDWNQPGSNFLNQDVDLSALGTLTPDTYEFRIQATGDLQADGVGDISNGGTFRIGDFFDSGQFTDFQFTGDVGPLEIIPEPSRALFLALALGTFLIRRKRS